MAKIENIRVYPTVKPAADDLLIATDVSDNNKTVTFLVSDLAGGAAILQGLQSVLDVDNVATGKDILLTGNINAFGGYMNADQYHINGSPGLLGQVLTSGGPSGSATWSTPSGGSPQDIQTTLGIGNVTTLSMLMQGAGQQLALSGGTDFNISGVGSDINCNAGSAINLSSTSTIKFTTGATITDYLDNTGTAGQILTVNALGTGLEWSTGVPGTAVPPLQSVLNVGHIATGGPGISMTNNSPLVLDTTSGINSLGDNNWAGINIFKQNPLSAPGAPVETIWLDRCYIKDTNGNYGTGKQVLTPHDPTGGALDGIFWNDQNADQTLQEVLDNGNEATQTINLHGDIIMDDGSGAITGDLVLGANVQIFDGTGTGGTVGYVLTATATGVEWAPASGGPGTTPNLSQVLAVGNTADNNIILTDTGGLGASGNITCVQITPTNIIANNGIGSTGQILSVTATGEIQWITNTATGMTNWLFEGDTGVQQNITQAALVQFLGDNTAISTQSASLDVLNISHDLFGTAGTYAFPSSITTNTTGHITSITTGAAPTSYALSSQANGANTELDLTDSLGNVTTVTLVPGSGMTISDNGTNQITFSAATAAGMTNFFIVSDSGTGSKQSVTDGIDYLFEGGTYITTVQVGGKPNTLTLNHDSTNRTNTTSAVSPAFGGTFTVIDTMTSNATGHVTDVNTKTITLPASSGVTSISVSDGLVASTSPSPITNAGNIQVDYLTTDNVVLSAAAWAGMAIDDLDTMLINDATTDTVKYISIADLKVVFAVGTVTTFSAQINGNALTESVTNPTTTPDLVLAWAGSASQYVNGAGDLINISTLANTTYDLSVPSATTDIRLAGSDGTNDDVTITGGANVTVTRISATELSIAASASSGLTSFTLDGNTGSQQTIDNTNPNMTVLGGTNLNSVMSATNTVTVDHNNQSRTDTPTTLTPSAGSVIPIVTAVTSSATGHVTGTDVKTITWPSFVSSVGLQYLTTGGSAVAGAPAFTVASSPIGGSGNLQLIGDGTSSQYVTGEGKLATFPTIPATPVYTLDTTQNGPVQVDIDLDLNGVSASQISLVGGTGITSITDASGVITIVASGTGTVTNFTASVGGNALTETVTNSTTTPDLAMTWGGTSSQYVNREGNLVTFPTIPVANEYTISTAASGVTDIADIDLTHSGSGSGVSSQFELEAGSNMSLSVAGNKITLSANATTGLSSFTLDGDSGPQQTVDTTNPDMNILGGTVLSSVASGTNNITLNHDPVTRNNTTSSSTPAFGTSIDFVDEILSSTEGHITGVNTQSVLIPAINIALAAPSAFTVSGSPITTGTGTLTFTGAGTSAQYIDGTGSLQTFPTIDNTTYTYDALQVGSNVDLQLTPSVGSVDKVKLLAGLGITLATGGTTDEVTISSINTGTVTNFNMTYSNAGGTATATQPAFVIGITNPTTTPVVTFTGDGTSSQYIDGTGSLQTFPAIDNTTYDLTTTAGATNFANINLVPNSGSTDVVQLEAGNNLTLSVNSGTGVITLNAAASSGLTAFSLEADSGSIQMINTTNDDMTISGGLLLNTATLNINEVVVNHNTVTTATSSASSTPGHGGQVSLVSALTMDGYGHVVDIETDTVTWPAAGGQVDSVGYTYTTPGPLTAVAGDPAFKASVGGTAINPVLDLEAQGKGSGQFIDGTGILRDFPPIPTQWSGWIADADVNTSPAWTINNATTLKFVGEVTTGGAGIVTSTIPNTELQIGLINNGGTPSATTFYNGAGQWATPTGNVYTLSGGTINTGNTNTFIKLEENGLPTSSSKITGTGGTTVSYDTALNTFTIDSSTGSATNFDVQGSTGSTVNITQSDTLSLLAGTGISTVSASGTDSVTISNTGVTKIIAGNGITINPTSGIGDVTIEATGGGKGSDVHTNRNFTWASWMLQNRFGTTGGLMVNPVFTYAPRLWKNGAPSTMIPDSTPGAGSTNFANYSAQVDDLTFPYYMVNVSGTQSTAQVKGFEGASNSHLFKAPLKTGGLNWSGYISQCDIAISGTPGLFSASKIAEIEIQLIKADSCGATFSNAIIVAQQKITSFTSTRTQDCYVMDLTGASTSDRTISADSNMYFQIYFNGTIDLATFNEDAFAGDIGLYIT